ncbi:MAG: prolyl oligopeptidase family serine peptidase [Novosphingobium sp.]
MTGGARVLAQGAAPPAPAVSSAPAAPFDPAKLTAADFAQLPFIEGPKLSPDGNRFAGFFGQGGTQVIGMFSLFDKAEKQVFIGIPDGTEADYVAWVNDDNVIVKLRSLLPVEGSGRWYISRLIGINRLTGKITKIMWDSGGQNAASVIRMPADDSSKILVAAQYTIYSNYPELFWPSVYEVDVTNGKKKRVLQGRENVLSWDADAQGTIRTGFKIAQSGRNWSLLYRGEGSGGNFRTIDKADTRKREGLLSPIVFLPGTDRALAMSEDDKGEASIYEVDLLTREQVRKVYTAPDGSEVAGYHVSADGLTLLGAYTSEAGGGIHWFDTALAELQAQFNKAVDTRSARIVSFSRDRNRMLVVVNRADTPGSLYFYDVGDGTMRKIADMNTALGARLLSPVTAVRYRAHDGLEIEAMLTLPKGLEARKLPIVILPHGGPWAQDTLSYDYWAQFIASRGYAVLQPNFRGSTGYGEDFTRKGEGELGLAMQDDLSDGLRWAVSQGIADPARACIVGASYGGYAAMWGIAKDPDQYKCAIAISGVSSLRREVNDMGDSLTGGLSKDAWQRMTPDFAAVSPINAIDRIKTPLLLIHGKKDVTVDHGQSASMNSRMQSAGKQVEMLSLPLADHHFTRQEDRQVLICTES